ncbi:MAG: ROK family transcriptional regulator [Alphaproteobacteria bacterium]
MNNKIGVNPLKARQFNRQLILQYIRLQPNISRVEIARAIELSAPSVTNITNDLINEGYVIETHRKTTQRGQPAVGLAINNKKFYTIGLHFDHHFHHGVLTNLAGDIVAEEKQTSKDTSAIFMHMYEQLSQKIPRKGELIGVGISSMGPILDPTKDNRDIQSPNIRIFDFVEKISAQTHHPIYIENSATTAAIGEFWYGKGFLTKNYLYLNIGYGLGGGLIINNQVYRGDTQNAGEIGHSNVVEDGRLCFCGAYGCLESYLSLNALIQELGDEYANPDYILSQFHQNNPKLFLWLEYNLPLLAKVLVSATQLMDINNIVISGLLPPDIINWYIHNLPKYIEKYRIKTLPSKLNIIQGMNGPNLPALGAATLPAYSSLSPKI